MRRLLLENQREYCLRMYCDDYTAGDNAHSLCVVWQQGCNWLPNSQHFLKRSWREGERLLWIVPFDNNAYFHFQIGESNNKPYEPAWVCKETVICQEERGQGWF